MKRDKVTTNYRITQNYRKKISFNDADRILHDDIKLAIEFIKSPPASWGGSLGHDIWNKKVAK